MSTDLAQVQTPPDEQSGDRIRGEARAIAARLTDTAWRHKGEATWFARRMIWPVGFQPSERPTVELLGLDWQNGCVGIANFLLDASKEFDLPEAATVAQEATNYAFNRRRRIDEALRNGFNSGNAGLLWLLDRLARETGDAQVFESRDILIDELFDARNKRSLLDQMLGDAGAVTTLAAILTNEEHETAESLAEFLADRIVQRANVKGDAVSWPAPHPGKHTPDITGISHGASGMGLALCAAHRHFQKEDYAIFGLGAFQYERDHRVDDGWLDLRNERTPDRPSTPRVSTGWCYGAPGFGVARAAAYQYMPTHHELRDEAIWAAELTNDILTDWSESPGMDSCLCHGVAGNADALLFIGEALGIKEWEDRSKQWAGWSMERYGSQHGIRWPNALPVGEFPALMTGVAGVGHWLMRLSSKDVRPATALLPPVAL